MTFLLSFSTCSDPDEKTCWLSETPAERCCLLLLGGTGQNQSEVLNHLFIIGRNQTTTDNRAEKQWKGLRTTRNTMFCKHVCVCVCEWSAVKWAQTWSSCLIQPLNKHQEKQEPAASDLKQTDHILHPMWGNVFLEQNQTCLRSKRFKNLFSVAFNQN